MLRPVEVAVLLEAPVGDGPLDRALLEVLYGCGLRLSEAGALALDDVDLASRQLRVLGKGNRERLVPIGRGAAAAPRAYLARGRPALAGAQTAPQAFLSRRGAGLTRQALWKIYTHVDSTRLRDLYRLSHPARETPQRLPGGSRGLIPPPAGRRHGAEWP